MDKETVLIFVCCLGIAAGIYAIVRELQPVLLAAVNFTGIAIIIVICAGSLCFCLIIIFLFTGNANSTGNQIAFELIEQRRINRINRMILKDRLAAKRAELKNIEIEMIEHTPDVIKYGGYTAL